MTAVRATAPRAILTGVWTVEVAEGSCGRVIRGTWQEDKDPPRPYPVVLRKL